MGMFPTSAVIHDLDSYLFDKSMEKYGFFTSQVPTCLFELVDLSKLPNRCSCLKLAGAPANPPDIGKLLFKVLGTTRQSLPKRTLNV